MDFFACIEKIAEKKISKAMERGEFKNLPGSGEPFQWDDKYLIPEELKLAYKILENASCIPPELELKKKIHTIEEMLEHVQDEQEKYRQIKKLNFLIMKLNMMRPVPVNMEKDQVYYGKMVNKMNVDKKKDQEKKET